MLEIRRRLRARGVLGINQRNAEFVRRMNPRRLYPLVDDKLRRSKRMARTRVAIMINDLTTGG